MPFKSDKQRRYMWANKPEIAKRWSEEEKKMASANTYQSMQPNFKEAYSDGKKDKKDKPKKKFNKLDKYLNKTK